MRRLRFWRIGRVLKRLFDQRANLSLYKSLSPFVEPCKANNLPIKPVHRAVGVGIPSNRFGGQSPQFVGFVNHAV